MNGVGECAQDIALLARFTIGDGFENPRHVGVVKRKGPLVGCDPCQEATDNDNDNPDDPVESIRGESTD